MANAEDGFDERLSQIAAFSRIVTGVCVFGAMALGTWAMWLVAQYFGLIEP